MKLARAAIDWCGRMSQTRHAGWALFALALITRGITGAIGGVRGDDEDKLYFAMAYNILRGEGPVYHHMDYGWVYSWLPPGMGYLYLPGFIFGEYNQAICRAFFVLMSAGTIVLFYGVAQRLLDRKYAFFAALAWALYPPQWFWGSRINPHNYATCASVLCFYLLYLGWEKRSNWVPVVMGFIWGTISLTRGEYALGIFFLAAVTPLAFENKREGIKHGLLLIAGWVLLFTPWVIRNYKLHDRFILIGTAYGDNIWKSYNPQYEFGGNDIRYPHELQERLRAEPNEAKRADILKEDALAFIRANPGRAVRNVVGNLLNFWRPWVSSLAGGKLLSVLYALCYIPIFIFFLAGLRWVPYKNPFWLALISFIAYKWLIHIPFYIIVRFREVIFPFLLLVACLGLEKFINRDRPASRPN